MKVIEGATVLCRLTLADTEMPPTDTDRIGTPETMDFTQRPSRGGRENEKLLPRTDHKLGRKVVTANEMAKIVDDNRELLTRNKCGNEGTCRTSGQNASRRQERDLQSVLEEHLRTASDG